jgi:hypothetical protein
MQDIANYDECSETLALLKLFTLAGKDVEAGKVRPVSEAFNRLRSSHYRSSGSVMRTGEAALLLRSPPAWSAGDTTFQRFRLLVHHLSRDAVVLYFRIPIGEAATLLLLLSNRHCYTPSPVEESNQFLCHINTPSSTIYRSLEADVKAKLI